MLSSPKLLLLLIHLQAFTSGQTFRHTERVKEIYRAKCTWTLQYCNREQYKHRIHDLIRFTLGFICVCVWMCVHIGYCIHITTRCLATKPITKSIELYMQIKFRLCIYNTDISIAAIHASHNNCCLFFWMRIRMCK